jgi:hypothetical protein
MLHRKAHKPDVPTKHDASPQAVWTACSKHLFKHKPERANSNSCTSWCLPAPLPMCHNMAQLHTHHLTSLTEQTQNMAQAWWSIHRCTTHILGEQTQDIAKLKCLRWKDNNRFTHTPERATSRHGTSLMERPPLQRHA